MKKRLARYINNKKNCSVCSVCEHPEHVPFFHSLSIVITHALSVHSLITMNTYVHLQIISSTAVLYYSTTPCSICTAESDRNRQQRAKQNQKRNVKAFAYAAKKIFGIQKKKTSLT